MQKEKNMAGPSIGIALSGGAAWGYAHLGVLQAFEHHDIRPDYISGTSVGALVGALYAFDIPLQEMRTAAEKLRWKDVSSFTISKLGLLSNEEIGELLEKMLGKVSIEEASIPLAIVAADIATGEKVVIRSGDLASAVMASSCVPGIFTPVKRTDRMLIDGMVVENLPISPLREMGADIIVAVNLGSEKKYREPDNLIDVLLNAFNIALDLASRENLDDADVLIEPKVAEIKRSDLKNAVQLYAEGYHAGSVAVGEIRSIIEKKKKSEKPHSYNFFRRLLSYSTKK